MRSSFISRNNNESYRPGLRQERRAAALLLGPSLAGTAVFYLLPFLEVVRRSFTDALGRRFVGLSNYKTVLANSAFRTAASNSARFLCVCIPALLALSLVMALLTRAAGRQGRVFSASFLLPLAVPVASIVLLWKVLFAQNGLANTLLTALGAQPVDFMGTGAAFWVLIATYLWKNSGYDMVLWAAGLDRIPKSQYEAAAVDGANAWQTFWAITWPGLGPTLGLTALLSLINSFKVFREAYLVAGSYPHESMYLLQHLFNNWFLSLELGRITAAAVIVDKAQAAGVPIVFFNRQPVAEDMLRWEHAYYVGAKAEEGGVLQGRLVLEAWQTDPALDRNGDGVLQYVMLEGEPGHQDAMLRTEYAVKTLTDAGVAVEKLASDTANWKRGQAMAKARQWLEEGMGDSIEVVFANNDDMALGAIDAFKQAEKDLPLVVGVDATAPALEAVAAGELYGTVRNDGAGIARSMLDLVLALAEDRDPAEAVELEDGHYVWLPYRAVTARDLEEKTP